MDILRSVRSATKMRMGLGRGFVMGARISPAESFPWNEADRMFTLLVKRTTELAHCHSGSPQEEEFDCLARAIEAYEAKRWPAVSGQREPNCESDTTAIERA
jgi:hypothetical protein